MNKVDKMNKVDRVNKVNEVAGKSDMEVLMRERSEMKRMLREDRRRERAVEKRESRYNQLTGRGCSGKRVKVTDCVWGNGEELYLPKAMVEDAAWGEVGSEAEYVKLRCRHDFEFWAWSCAKIKKKKTGDIIPFKLNYAQRKVLALLEEDRLADKPIRLILLKARQWGGSTLVQLYMAWIQSCLRRNWHSIICGHNKDTAANIRGMYNLMLNNYPKEYYEGDTTPQLRGFQDTKNTREIMGRGCRVTVGTSENQDAMRGIDIAMAHLSEVAYWRNTTNQNPESFIQAVCGAVNYQPLTLIAIESTANGVGNYFHREWIRATEGKSDKRPIFVAWHEIEIYRTEPEDRVKFAKSLNEEERRLWEQGLSLSQINWYRNKRKESESEYTFQAEYPSTPDEAFMQTDRCIFEPEDLQRMRNDIADPILTGDLVAEDGAVIGEKALHNLKFMQGEKGELKLWQLPRVGSRYVAAVDIGGRSADADWSVIVVVKCPDAFSGPDAKPEVVAEWRGHCDHDLLAWKAAQVASFFNRAMLVFESNTLEQEAIEGSPAEYVLQQVAEGYPNLYRRGSGAYGFHVNRSTKTTIVNRMISMMRDHGWIERSRDAMNELTTYESQSGGKAFGASAGHHDDLVMARAIAFEVAAEEVKMSRYIQTDLDAYVKRFRT